MLQQIKQAQKRNYWAEKYARKINNIPDDVQYIIKQKAKKDAIAYTCCIMATTLNSLYGFGAKRIDAVIEQTLKQLDAVQTDEALPRLIIDECIKIGMDFKKFGYIVEE